MTRQRQKKDALTNSAVRSLNLGEGNAEILKQFRQVSRSHVEVFRAAKDHIYHLLGPRQRYPSGIFREGLIKEFLRGLLPRSVSVDSGFIYGFEEVATSDQLDVIVWDSGRHSAVYRAGDFVIVPPESAICVLSVKSTLAGEHIADGLRNLLSVVPLDYEYRVVRDNPLALPPIEKFLVSYAGPSQTLAGVRAIAAFYRDTIDRDTYIADCLFEALKDVDAFDPSRETRFKMQRVFPALIASIESREASYFVGLGPPEDLFARRTFGPGLRRLPYVYPQHRKVTTPFEKLIYQILSATYRSLGTVGGSLAAAWGDFNPRAGARLGDASETMATGATVAVNIPALEKAAVRTKSSRRPLEQ